MTKFNEAVAFVRSLRADEKISFLQQVLVSDDDVAKTGVSITKTEGVCGGSARIRDTRIPVWSIVEAKKLNFSDERILTAHPTLSLQDIENALLYYARNREEIELELTENEEA